jgi:L-threonine kinase
MRLVLDSRVPRGRGYGSSTADVGAAIYATAQALGQELMPMEAGRLAVGIEPSDSTVLPHLALLDHRNASRGEILGPAPRLAVMVIDPGGEVDTIAFNRLDHREALRQLETQHREAFALLKVGITRSDVAAVGAAATLSACVHQTILHNPLLEAVIQLGQQVGACGICRAHSGTLLGILLDERVSDVVALMEYIRRRLAGLARIAVYPLVDGGPRPGISHVQGA